MRVIEVVKTGKGVTASLSDGMGMYVRRTANPGCPALQSTVCTYVVFCVDYKTCKNLNESNAQMVLVDGKASFLFHTGGTFEASGNFTVYNRELLKSHCASGGINLGYCTTLLARDAWEIKDDYPVKF